MMILKNILINNKEEFLEELLRELIKYNISYVLIENEIHFDNKIYRFYTKEEVRKQIIKELDMELDFKDIVQIDYTPKKSLNKGYQSPRNTKQLIKNRNRQIHQQLKRYQHIK